MSAGGLAQTVFIVDDDAAVRHSLALLVRSVGFPVAEFASADEFLQQGAYHGPGCLVTDIRMPGTSGLELQEILRSRGSRLPVVFITGHGDVAMAVRAMRAGAVDFIEKPFRDQELLDRINQALALDREQAQARDEESQLRARFTTLTPREAEVLRRIAAGQANKVIAMELGLSERTVEIHRAKVMTKTGARSLAELVQMVTRLGPG